MATYSTTNAPLPWMEPYMQDYLGRAQDVANQPYQASPGTYTGPNSLLTSGWDMAANRAMTGSPEMDAARQQLTTTIQGGAQNPYASMDNPYLSQSISDAQGDLANSWNMVQKPQWDKAMQNSGSFGNTGVQQYAAMDANNLQRNMARIGTDMRMGAYNTGAQLTESGLGRQQQAIGMAPTIANQDWTDLGQLMNAGGQMQGFNQANQNQNQQWWQEAQNFPQQQLDAYGRAIGINAGGTSTQQQPDPSRTSEIAGGALTGAALWNMLFGGGGTPPQTTPRP